MIDCIGQSCPVCNRRFLEGDDVVVCPDCGSPHHRECYKELGMCAHHDQHGTDFTWKAVAPEPLPKSCPNCNTTNEHDAPFCKNCGMPMDAPIPLEIENEKGIVKAISAIEMFDQITSISDNEELDGIKVKDWKTYIGTAAPRYLFTFKRMDETGRKTSFCMSAMFFAPFYFLYRRMWLIGIIALLLEMVLSLPSTLLVLSELYNITVPIEQQTLILASNIFSFIMLAANACWALFAYYLYRLTAAKQIKRIKETAETPEEYNDVLKRKSGPCNIVIVVLVGLLVFALFSQL